MKTHSASWYESMYNNRALVPDHAAHFADWSKTSADARAALKCTLRNTRYLSCKQAQRTRCIFYSWRLLAQS